LKPKSTILWLIIGAAIIVFLVWRIGYYQHRGEGQKSATPAPSAQQAPEQGVEQAAKPGTEKVTEPSAEAGAEQIAGSTGEPGKMTRGQDRRHRRPGDRGQPGEPNALAEATEPNEVTKTAGEPNQLEAINLKDAEMKDIIPKLAQWTGKVIIPDNEVLKQKITIYSPTKLPRDEAIQLIYASLLAQGFIAEQTDKIIYLRPVKEARFGNVPTIAAQEPLAVIADKSQIVQKFFKLRNYSPTQLQKIILPMIPEHGYVTADESTSNLMVIDTVENLLRIQRIIDELDVPEAENTVTRIFEIREGDPAEIVQVLKILLEGRQKNRSQAGQVRGGGGGGGGGGNEAKGGPGKNEARATVVEISATESPLVLIPEPKRKWIIAKASSNDMNQVAEWLEKLDSKQPVQREQSLRKIEYADVVEVASQITQMIDKMPGSQIKASVMVQPLEKAGQIMIIGSKENREMIEKLIDEIDIPRDKLVTEHFKLKFADPEQLKTYIEELYAEQGDSGLPWWYRSQRRSTDEKEMVRVIAYTTLKQLTIIASAENIEKIRAQIAEWDQPINVQEVAPQIIELKNSDPVEMARLLTTLFTEEKERQRSIWDYYFDGGQQAKKKIVGPLYGQLTFEAVPQTKKIIVISKVPEAYEVVRELVKKLDGQEPAELPIVITLKYADAEDLCEQLNALLNETGTISTLRRSTQGLAPASIMDNTSGTSNTSNNQANKDNTNNPDYVTPWWNRAPNRVDRQMPTSNLIGRIRFIPVYRSKAILILTPPEFEESVRELVTELDKSALQVMVKAIVVEVDHNSVTSLGIKLATDPLALGVLGENALAALTAMTYAEQPGRAFAIDSSLNVSALVDLLVKHANAKILNQPTLWTKDNEEAYIFKGKQVAFIENVKTSTEGLSTQRNVVYRPVGVLLRVRPKITPEKAVDMTINIEISQVDPDRINNEISTSELKTTTHMIVDNGQTLLLSGILFQTDSQIETKVPLLGDIPLVGGLFRHEAAQLRNNELLVFITPNVMDEEAAEALTEINNSYKRMQSIVEELRQALEKDDM